jgi:glycosyltransferase involved in cell wall biosynthesis
VAGRSEQHMINSGTSPVATGESGGADSPEYSFVIPAYDERGNLPDLFRRVGAAMDQLDAPAEAVLVDDGSTDGTYELARDLRRSDPRFRVIRLSRNFGHQVAVTAGLDHSRGRAVIIMDGDLQDPPELATRLAERWRSGYDVVYAVREARPDDTWFKRVSAAIFYGILGRLSECEIPANVGDFRLVDRRVVDVIAKMPEQSRFLRGLFAWAGFRQTSVPFVRQQRPAGDTKYPLPKMLKFAVDAVVSFSNRPLRLALMLGFLASFVAFVGAILAVVAKLSGAFVVPGWASLAVITFFLGGMQLLTIGVMGEYIGRIYEEVKRRPLYVASESEGFGPSAERREFSALPPLTAGDRH